MAAALGGTLRAGSGRFAGWAFEAGPGPEQAARMTRAGTRTRSRFIAWPRQWLGGCESAKLSGAIMAILNRPGEALFIHPEALAARTPQPWQGRRPAGRRRSGTAGPAVRRTCPGPPPRQRRW